MLKQCLGEFPEKKCGGMSFQTYTSRYIFFFVKWRNVQLCMQINFITIFFIYCTWFSRNNSISGATSLTALRKEILVSIRLVYFTPRIGPHTLNLHQIQVKLRYMYTKIQARSHFTKKFNLGFLEEMCFEQKNKF